MKARGRRPGAPHKFPWTQAALDGLRLISRPCAKPLTMRELAGRLKAAGLVDQVPDPATVSRALKRLEASR